ncbi:kinase-like domain-containing protein [Mycena filopes]|nr:kinase-like domain-containing protein [Mycena filopes]
MAFPVVPALTTAYSILSFIVAGIQAVDTLHHQLHALSASAEQLLQTLDTEFTESRLSPTSCAKPLADVEALLREIHRFTEGGKEAVFLKLLFQKDSRMAKIDTFHRRLGMCIDAFQISSLLNIQSMLADSQRARERDVEALNERLADLEKNNTKLLQTLEINQNNTIALMVSIQKQLNNKNVNAAEEEFYTHTLRYLTSKSGQDVTVEEWMISSFEIEYGPEIGAGGFGTVYRGRWNQTHVAIKVLQNVAGVKPSNTALRDEIDLWSTLRHPHILQFLGANTLDDEPFIVMPYVRYNAKQFLRAHPESDPLLILRDISLGLQYLHSRKICHGDLKAINVLVELTGKALLCDFGLARLRADAASRTWATVDGSSMVGSRNWMAPELLTGARYRVTADVYAFGMTLYELYTDEIPMLSVPYGDFIDLVVRRGVRPERPEPDEGRTLPDEVWKLAEECWAANPSERPIAMQIHNTIMNMISDRSNSDSEKVDFIFSLTEQAAPSSGILIENDSTSTTETLPVQQLFAAKSVDKDSIEHERVRQRWDDNISVARKIEILSSTASEDWDLTLDICADVAATEANAKEAVRALRREFHYGDSTTQLAAARLWAILLRHSNITFVNQCTTKKFLSAIENLLTSPNTLPVVRERVMKILAAAAYVSGSNKESDAGFRGLWRRVRTDHEPEEGTPFDSATLFGGPSSPLQPSSEVFRMDEYLRDTGVDGITFGQDWDLTPDDLRRLLTLQENVLSENQQTLGADHPETLLGASNLGLTYFRLGMLHQAEELQSRVVDKRKVVSGTDHQDTLTAMFHLAATYRRTKRLEEALALGTEVVQRRRKLFGAFSLPTLAAVHGVALTCHYMRRYSQPKENELTDNVQGTEELLILAITHEDVYRTLEGQVKEP